jgi:glycerol-3-phosphate O-acyltransferase
METRPVRHSAAPPYKPNALLRWLYRRFFRHIHVDEHWSGVVHEAAQRGVVVYVMRSLSFLDFFCLDYLVKRFGLPLVRFVNDLGLWILEPFGKGGRRLRLRRQVPEERALGEVVRSHYSAQLFLRRPPKFGKPRRKGQQLETDLLQTLVHHQREMDTPILLIPQTFVWNKLPPKRGGGLLDALFGPVEWPGKIRVFFQFLLNYRNALLRSGEPFDLGAFVAEHEELSDSEIADRVRYAMLRRIERERALVLGPRPKSRARIQEELIRSPRVRKHIEAESRATGKPVPKIERYARKELGRLCADPNPYVLSLMHRSLESVWNRIYDGMVVDKEGIERLRNAARDGAVVLLPSHKSHVDYLVLSCVLFDHALSPPLIAAGDNLSFWPLGPLLRRSGAFFIRRSFRGRKLYAALVDAYMRKLLVEGFPIEFFLEGGRSRTGKLLPPKYGLMSMFVDAALLLRNRKIRFVPISIGYERIVEERSYVHELSGGDKPKENLGELLKTPQVLRSKYGRLYVQIGEILDFDDVLQEVLEEQGAPPDRDHLTPPRRRMLVQRLAHRAVYEIDRVAVVTPAALVASALLVHRRRGMTHQYLVQTCAQLLQRLDRFGARVARQIRDEQGQVRDDVIQEAVGLFMDAKLIVQHDADGDAIYAIPEERRLALEYYKNTILHFFVPNALISAALLAGGREPVAVDTLRERVRQLSRAFKYEFMYRADAPFDEIFDDALQDMLTAEEIEQTDDSVRPAANDASAMLPVYSAMLRTYFESYVLALRGAASLLEGPVNKKDWIKRTLAIGQRMYLAGALELRESLSKPKLENALLSMRDYRLVRIGEDQVIRAGERLTDRDHLKELERQLDEFLV